MTDPVAQADAPDLTKIPWGVQNNSSLEEEETVLDRNARVDRQGNVYFMD